MITKVVIKIASGKAAGQSGSVAEILEPILEVGVVEVRDLIEDLISGRKASLSICTRAEEML